MNENEEIYSNMVRIGTVSKIDDVEHKVRVMFQDKGITSGWLKVIRNFPFIPDKDVQQKTEKRSGGSGEESFAEHDHDLIIKPWMPNVGDTVLCLYIPIFNGDGYVIGGL